MKKNYISAILLILLASTAFSQNAKNEELIAIIKKAAEAQENYDPMTLDKLYASDYIEISPKGEIDEREKAIGFYKVDDVEKAKSRTPRYILDDFKVRNYGKYAMIISRFSIAFKNDSTKPPTPVGLVLYGLRKEKGVWKIYSAQFTPFPPPQKPTK
ncbi:MAG TPA: nuclear transport factor 2 family protein [Pyrinomonadaceae bacterium]|nr:nuclear transport factor 2 family protein [Pyrinomonadaceae bacterium]